MNAPFFQLGYFDHGFSLIIALIIGIAFGFFLERGGLGNARKLAGQFYLTDLTVFKVMFTGIVTAMLGLFWFSKLGLLNLSLIDINETYLLPHLFAGLIFGIGFVIGGLCPGTACVASATGRIDGIVLLLGIFFGIFAFGETFSLVGDFTNLTAMRKTTLPQLLGAPQGFIIFAVTLIALLGFVFAGFVEKFSNRHKPQLNQQMVRYAWHKWLGISALCLAIVAAFIGEPYSQNDNSIFVENKPISFVNAPSLAELLMSKKGKMAIVDLRTQAEYEKYHLPFAVMAHQIADINDSELKTDLIIFYNQKGLISVNDRQMLKMLSKEKGSFILQGGLDSWVNEVLFPDLTQTPKMTTEQAEKIKRTSRYFGGKPILANEAIDKRSLKYRREGC